MASNLVEIDGAKPTKFRAVEDIIKDALLRATLENLVDEAVKAKVAIQKQQQRIRDLKEQAKVDLCLDPKLFSLYANMMFNNDYAKRQHDNEQAGNLIHYVMMLSDPATRMTQISQNTTDDE